VVSRTMIFVTDTIKSGASFQK